MARMRTIKPSFFCNEELLSMSPTVRLLFIGLWTIADRRGRLEDRPVRIKIQVLPVDDCDVDDALTQLQEKDLLIRYEVEGARYIQILNFEKHQIPHVRETESVIPCLPSIKEGEGTAKAGAEHSQGSDETQPRSPVNCKPLTVNRELLTVNREPESASLASDVSPDGDARAGKPKPQRHKPITDEYIAELVVEFAPQLGGPECVRERIERAMNHRASDGWKDKRRGLHDWLSRDVERLTNGQQSTRASPNGKPALSAAAQRFVGVERTFGAEGEIAGQEAGP